MRSGRIVVVTGAAGGMGRITVDRFLANGDTVVAADWDEQALGELSAAQSHDARFHPIVADIADEAQCARVSALAEQVGNRVDVLVDMAGHYPIQPFDEMTPDDFRRIVDINLTGHFLMVRALAPLLRGRGWGRVVIIGSASMFDGVSDQIHYVAAKAGIVGLARSLALVLGNDGVTVNVVTPGLTLTPPVEAHAPRELIRQQPALRAISRDEHAEDVVGAVFFLASPDADFISGQTVNVDGGKHKL